MVELEPCPSCGALPCDWTDNPHTRPSTDEALLFAAASLERADRALWNVGMKEDAQARVEIAAALAKIKELGE